MKARINNEQLEDFNKTYKVKKMTYDYVVLNKDSAYETESYKRSDVELIGETKIDEFLINNPKYLKIKLKRGISVVFYTALEEALKSELNEDIKELNILSDKYRVNKRGIWDKQLVVLVNDKKTLEINASGQNFRKDSYDINITPMDKLDFINLCTENIDKLSAEVEFKQNKIKELEYSLNCVKNLTC